MYYYIYNLYILGRGWKKITRRCGSRTDQGMSQQYLDFPYYEVILIAKTVLKLHVYHRNDMVIKENKSFPHESKVNIRGNNSPTEVRRTSHIEWRSISIRWSRKDLGAMIRHRNSNAFSKNTATIWTCGLLIVIVFAIYSFNINSYNPSAILTELFFDILQVWPGDAGGPGTP